MREIKFRAYAQNTESMVYQKDFNKWVNDYFMNVEFNETEMIAEHVWIENEGERFTADNPPIYSGDDMVKLMQYTGLKDKNGKEIYEGDIVEVSPYDRVVIRFFEGAFLGINLFEGKFIARSEYEDVPISEINHFKIIGNIHEHSHLLNGDNHA